MESRMVVTRGLGVVRGMRSCCFKGTEFVWQDDRDRR